MSPRIPAPKQADSAAAESRERILDAALAEFASKGLAGARTEAIAAAAGVNKALLYYYFASKEKLYEAALERIAMRARETSMAALTVQASAGERVLRAALSHFDRVLTQREFQSLMQQEMMRFHRGDEGSLPVLIDNVFRPVMLTFQATVREGIASGELIAVDEFQMMLAGLGANVFYFLSAQIWATLLDFNPFSAETLKARREALVRFLGQALFIDRKHGAEIAEHVLTAVPVPEIGDLHAMHHHKTNSKMEKSK